MMYVLYSLIVLSTCIILLYCLNLSQGYSEGQIALPSTTFLFSVWLIACAVWGPYFFVIRPPGIFDITIERILFALVLLILAVGILSGAVDFSKNIITEVFMLLFIIICLASMLRYGFRAAGPELPPPWTLPAPWNIFINGYLFPFCVFLYAKNYLLSERSIIFVFKALFFLGVYLSIIAFFEFFNLRQFVFPRYINIPEIWLHLERARGPFLNAAYNGMAIIFGFVCGVHLVSRTQGFQKFAYIVSLSLFFPAVFFTQTRSIYLSFLLVLVVLLIFYKTSLPKWKLFALPIAFCLIFFLMFSPRLTSSERRAGGVYQVVEVRERILLIQRSVLMIADNPFLGVGLAQFIPASLQRYKGRVPIPGATIEHVMHSHILGMLVELGIIGTAIYLVITVAVLRHCFKLFKIFPETGIISFNLALIIFIVWISYYNNNLFVDPAYSLFVNVVPFLFGGIADGLYNKYLVT